MYLVRAFLRRRPVISWDSFRGSFQIIAVLTIFTAIILARNYHASQKLNEASKKNASVVFDWRSAEPRQLRPFKTTYHLTMGIEKDDLANLITIDRDFAQRLEQRRQIVHENGRRVYGCLPGGKTAVKELYDFLLGDFLPTRYPSIFKIAGDGNTVKNTATGRKCPTYWSVDDPEGALRKLAETVEEDMFLLRPTPEGHFSDAFLCCFPSGFDPSKKLGKILQAIHGPVPSYEKIGSSMERFFSKLEVGRNVKRTNWSVQTHGELFAIDGNHITKEDQTLYTREDFTVDSCFLRVELQTLMRLPKTRAILFSFKTYLYPISQVKSEGNGPRLADAIEGLKKGNAPGMWIYKGGVRWGEQVCAYLRD